MPSPFSDVVGDAYREDVVRPLTRAGREALREQRPQDFAGLSESEVDSLYYGLHHASTEGLVAALSWRGWRVRLER